MSTTTTPRSPADEYTGPPKSWFLEDSWHERDLEAIFRPRWLFVGHVDEIDGAGDTGYLTFALGAEEVVVRRDEEGRIRAYHNFCPHRGARLCDGRVGRAPSKRIVCPYHLWTYAASDGALLHARLMHEDFDREAVGLVPVHVDVWKGLVFVCLAEDAPAPMAEQLAGLSWGGYDFDAMTLAAFKSHELAANWKVVVENNCECYHCKACHPELSAIQSERDYERQPHEFDAHCELRAGGLDVAGFARSSTNTIGGERVCAVPSPREKGATGEAGTIWFMWEPGVMLHVSRDFAWMFVPKPLDAGRTELRQYWFVAKEAQEGRDFDRDRLMAFWDTTMSQDRDLVERVQHGMRMPAYVPGPLNRRFQGGQAGFFRWYTAEILARFPDQAATA